MNAIDVRHHGEVTKVLDECYRLAPKQNFYRHNGPLLPQTLRELQERGFRVTVVHENAPQISW